MSDIPASEPAPPSEAPPSQIPGDRTISPVSGRFGVGRAGKVVSMAALVAGCGIFLAATWRHGAPKAHAAPAEPARQGVNFEPAKTDPPSPTLAAPGASPPVLDSSQRVAGGPIVPAIQP